MTYRVVNWSTGNIGRHTLPSIARHKDLELVGVWVHSPEKVGKDAGSLVGMDPIGITATNDVDELLALKPDCICYTGQGEELGDRPIKDIARFLEAGINIVTSSTYSLIYPPSMPADWRDLMETAAVKGGASAFSTGIEPGYTSDQLSLTLMMMAGKFDSIRIQEFYLYDKYPVRDAMVDMGFAMPMDAHTEFEVPGRLISVWGGCIRLLAKRLGLKLDTIRESYERAPTPRTLEVACGTIEAGTTGAIRLATIGVVDGRDTLIIEHVNKMAEDLAPEWPFADKNGTYRVTIEGTPKICCDLTFGSTGEGIMSAANLLVNAIPYVCDAKPGLLTSEDFPIPLPKL